MSDPVSPHDVERVIVHATQQMDTLIADLATALHTEAAAEVAYKRKSGAAFQRRRMGSDKTAERTAEKLAEYEAINELNDLLLARADVKTFQAKKELVLGQLSGAQSLVKLVADQAGHGVYGRSR